jgi:hypothetical protein
MIYMVCSGEMTYPGALDDPPEPYAICVEISADSPREAKIKALRHPMMWNWVQHQRDNDSNPFSGLTVEYMEGMTLDFNLG